ncbi:HDOD domain-containing protein [Methylophaga sp.]|jgi:HD-like signal output (HDOD) protein|uniref:HDOD domain-containing protein n=1 Tax=Methylophaga sp. TaxID=2024840 RepID=UPI0025F473ED|nr:HDOD domain-containing protein [Methylophaga sp.]|tara:strand:+ start:1563 stop:3005 length:1443 start_codon:yes stop_codon:yes gene_type:complete
MTPIPVAAQRFIHQLTNKHMPVFPNTMLEINQILEQEDSAAVDVAQVILRDAALTSRLLKMANSVYYNPQGHHINTVSRALMLLGFEQVKVLALTLVLIDSLKATKRHDKVLKEMAVSLHAAVQAQNMATLCHSETPEDIFIAALLSRLGHLTFWAFADEKTVTAFESRDCNATAESDVLGFTLQQLTQGLAEAWSLNDLLIDSFRPNVKSESVLIIRYAGQLAIETSKGWNADKLDPWFEKVASLTHQKLETLKPSVHESALSAQKLLNLTGSERVRGLIPLPPEVKDEGEQQDVSSDLEPAADYPAPDQSMQLRILQDISQAIQEHCGINLILEMVMEGIYRGAGMDRVIFAVLSADKKQLNCRYVLGNQNEQFCELFQISIDSNAQTLFKDLLAAEDAVLIDNSQPSLLKKLHKESNQLMAGKPMLAMPLKKSNKPVGLFLADRQASDRGLNRQDLIAFRQFCQQASLAFTFLTIQG